MKIVALVGMAGSGKSEVARYFEKNGYNRIRFGDITDIEVKKRGLPLNEANELIVREQLRKRARYGGLCQTEFAPYRSGPAKI